MNALTLPERAAVALGTAEHEIKLIALAKESTDIVAVTNTAGREQAHRIGMNLRTTRTTIQNIGKDARDDATKFSKAIIAEENRLISIIQPEETRVIGLRDGFDAEEKARKDALIAAERARVDAIQSDIQAIRNMLANAVGKPVEIIKASIEILEELEPAESRFAEFTHDAAMAIGDALIGLDGLHEAAIATKAEAARIKQEREAAETQAKADREELAAAQAKLKADQEAQAAEQAALLAAWEKNAAIERAAIAEQQRITKAAQDSAKAESDRAAAALKAAQDEFNAKIAAHEAKIANEANAAQKLIDDAAHAELMAESMRLDKIERELAEAQRMKAASGPATEAAAEIEMITITKVEYEDLLERDGWLSCLEESGVDNWIGFNEARKVYDNSASMQ